ncbi:MAG: fumarylacetoacetate hydrolase family protein [Caldilineaceae bacterium]|nr:fumarylacetoacetate hydrolase family protein [Caldilineaceae bacterium]
MKLITYQLQGETKIGALSGSSVIDLARAYATLSHSDSFPTDMLTLLREGEAGLTKAKLALAQGEESAAYSVPVATVTFLPPVVRPGKVIALGRNYAEHAKEGGAEVPEHPMWFHKTHTSLNGHLQPIIIPPGTSKVDYEGELAVIIGKTCKFVTVEEALDYVAGYAVANDVSARDWQRRTTQFAAGKMVDTFGPLGPALVTKDEIPDVQNLQIHTHLNGQLMQDGNTRDMIFSVAYSIADLSRICTLEVGDVIMTGTPEGVGFARKPPVFMQEGDVISIAIEGLGTLTNPLKNYVG